MRVPSKLAVLAILASAGAGCLPDTSGIDPPGNRFIYPVGLAAVPGDQILLVANSNFDLEYNAGTLVALDITDLESADSQVSGDDSYRFIDESSLIYSDETIRFGAFASDLELTPSGDRAIIPVRGERAIILVDVGSEGDLLSCGEDSELRCDSAHRVESNDRYDLPIEPYEVAAVDFEEPNGEITTLGMATHLSGGEVSLFVLRDGMAGGAAASELIRVISGVVPGASGIAVNPVNRHIYVAGRNDPDPSVAVLRVMTDSGTGYYSKEPFFDQVSHISLSSDMYAGTDARGIAVTSSGDRAFLATRSPDALLELDTGAYRMTDMTTVCTDPSVVAVHEDDRGTETEDDDAVYAFVLCFLTDQVFVVDASLMKVVAVRSTGAGPHAIAFDDTRERAFVSNFRESTLTIIESVHPFDHLRDEDGRIVKVGVPRLPEGHD